VEHELKLKREEAERAAGGSGLAGAAPAVASSRGDERDR
jgi:hypothetical protein